METIFLVHKNSPTSGSVFSSKEELFWWIEQNEHMLKNSEKETKRQIVLLSEFGVETTITNPPYRFVRPDGTGVNYQDLLSGLIEYDFDAHRRFYGSVKKKKRQLKWKGSNQFRRKQRYKHLLKDYDSHDEHKDLLGTPSKEELQAHERYYWDLGLRSRDGRCWKDTKINRQWKKHEQRHGQHVPHSLEPVQLGERFVKREKHHLDFNPDGIVFEVVYINKGNLQGPCDIGIEQIGGINEGNIEYTDIKHLKTAFICL